MGEEGSEAMGARDLSWWLESKTDAELISRAGRCTSLACGSHGALNRELRRRRLAREAEREAGGQV